MNNLTLLDENFDIQKTLSCHISIQIGMTGYSLCVLDTVENKYVVLKNVNFPVKYSLENEEEENTFYSKVKEIIRDDDFLTRDYKSVKFIFLTRKSTIVPFDLFEITKLKSFFDINQVLCENESVNYAKLNNIGAYSVFALPSFLTTVITNRFKNVKFYQQTIPLIEFVTSRAFRMRNSTNATNVYVNSFADFFDIVVVNSSNLVLHNSFSFQNDTDFVYYVLNVMTQLQLNPDTVEVCLSGFNVEKSTTLFVALKKYISNLRFLSSNSIFKYSTSFAEIPEHSFVNLYNLYTCV